MNWWKPIVDNGVAIGVLIVMIGFVYKVMFSPPKWWREMFDGWLSTRQQEAESRKKQAESLMAVGDSLKGVASALTATQAVQDKMLSIFTEVVGDVRGELKELRLLVRTVLDRADRQDAAIDQIQDKLNGSKGQNSSAAN